MVPWRSRSRRPKRRAASIYLLALWLAALPGPGCRTPPPTPPPRTESTAELLKDVAQDLTSDVPFAGEPRVVERLLPHRNDRSPEHFEQRLRLAQALLRVGDAPGSVELFDELLEDGPAAGLGPDELLERVELPRAVACLRLGEQENCIAHHNADSCLYPLRGGALHDEPRGSRAARAAFASILERRPDDLEVKWLLNIACATLGDLDCDLPPEWRLLPSTRRAPRGVLPFTNVAGEVGLGVNTLSGGCVLDDLDGDGNLDVLASAIYPLDGPGGQLRLFLNEKDGTFRDATEGAGLEGIRGGLNLVPADYDNDGDLDVLVLRGAWQMDHGKWPNTLLRNNGGGTFSDETVRAGVFSMEPTQAAAWGDFDRDGWVDLYVGNETGFPVGEDGGLGLDLMLWLFTLGYPQVQGHLYHNEQNGTFRDLFQEVGFKTLGWVKGVAWGDYDRDGLPDLYLSRYGAPNLLYHNDGPDASGSWGFSDVTAVAGVAGPVLSFPTWFFDYDEDGWDDLFVGGFPRGEVSFPGNALPYEIKMSSRDEVAGFLGQETQLTQSKPRLYHNRGDGTFEDVTREAGLWRSMSVMGSNFGDLDGDGYLDLYLGTGAPSFAYLVPNRAFRNLGNGTFEDVTVATRLGTLAKGHAVAFGDVDNDGDQDIYTVLGGAFPGDTFPNALFLNPGQGNSWISLRLEGRRSNRAALGARIQVTLSGRKGVRHLHRTVSSGGSFGASTLRQEIGLGRLDDSGEQILDVAITWPDRGGSIQSLGPLAPNAFYNVLEGEAARRVDLPRLHLGPEGPAPGAELSSGREERGK